jgi:hypothetical protein
MLLPCELGTNRATNAWEFSLSEGKNTFSPSEMVKFIKYLQKYGDIRPRTYWWETPFYTVISNFRQKFCLGNRPQDLDGIDKIEKRACARHLAYQNRLDRFPLDKAEYYLRLKESHGVNSIRELGKIAGEDWSYIAKIVRTLDLPEVVKDFLRNNKNDPAILRFFHLRRLLDIVRESEERLQIGRFRELMQELEEENISHNALNLDTSSDTTALTGSASPLA